jgi:PAS domain S-box-containing protein
MPESERGLEELKDIPSSFDIIEAMVDAVTVMDLEGRIIMARSEFLKALELTNQDIIGKDAVELGLMSLKDAERLMTQVMPVLLAEGYYRDFAISVTRKDDSEFSISVNFSLLRSPEGEPLYIIGVARDISKLKEMERELRESEELFRNLMEKLPQMIFINKGGRVVYANDRCAEVMGYKKEEFYSPDFDFLEIIAPEYRALAEANFHAHMDNEEVATIEYELVTKEGNRIPAVLATRLVDYQGERAILGIVTDLRERKKTEEESRNAKELLYKTFQSLDSAVFILDAKVPPVITECNPAATRIFGYEKEELLGKTVRFLHSDEKSMTEFQNVLREVMGRNGPTSTFSFRMRRKNGEVIETEHRIRPLQNGKGKMTGWISVVKDTTIDSR